jgi:hypothetical protein
MQLKAKYACLAGLLLWGTLSVSASESENDEADADVLEIIEVTGQRVANLQPASSYAATVTQLRFDPQIDIQARGLPEGLRKSISRHVDCRKARPMSPFGADCLKTPDSK